MEAPERRRPRRQVLQYPSVAGRPFGKIGRRRRANPTLRNERVAFCEAGSGIYRRLGAVLNLPA